MFLKQLTVDKQIFKDLPAKVWTGSPRVCLHCNTLPLLGLHVKQHGRPPASHRLHTSPQRMQVQRQVWEFDKNQLQQDALPPVGQYKYEVATIMRALAMDEFLPSVLRATAAATAPAGSNSEGAEGAGEEDSGGPSGPRHGGGVRRTVSGRVSGVPRAVTRKILRKGSYVVQALKGMVGTSPKIYNQIVELCVVKYRDSDGLYVGHKELSYCTLRTQLLMALHDDNSPVAPKDRCHELAWTLDAGITNGGGWDHEAGWALGKWRCAVLCCGHASMPSGHIGITCRAV